LGEDSSRGKVQAVSLDMEEFQVLGPYQDQSGGHCHLETFESFLFFGIPVLGFVGTSEVEERSSYGREILDKAMVEINEAYESLHVSLVLWDGPIMDSSDFHRVHHNFVLQNDQSKVFNLPLVELTFLQAEE